MKRSLALMPSLDRRRELLHAAAIGAIHGTVEHAPVSSSAHVALVPLLFGWPPPPAAHEFAVALHAGSLPGLIRGTELLRPRHAALSALPAAAIGYLLDRRLSSTFGGLRATCAGLIAGSVLIAGTDASASSSRPRSDLHNRDALTLGLVQSLALLPGLSRLGVAVATARALGFDRSASFSIARSAGMPLVIGATLLKAVRAVGSNVRGANDRRADAGVMIAGTTAAAAASLIAAPLLRSVSIRVSMLERVALATAALTIESRRRRNRPTRPSH